MPDELIPYADVSVAPAKPARFCMEPPLEENAPKSPVTVSPHPTAVPEPLIPNATVEEPPIEPKSATEYIVSAWISCGKQKQKHSSLHWDHLG